MSTRSGGPKTNEGKAVTRYNATKSGIYSVTPVVPHFERQSEWLAHRAGVFADLNPEGYMQEIIAERIAIKTWRLRRLVRYEREQIRNRQRNIGTDLAILAMSEHRKLAPEPEKRDLEFIDRWAMDYLIPREKELAILMRWEGRLTRELRLDLLHLEHMKRQRRGDKRQPLLSLAEPEPFAPPLRPDEEPESRPLGGLAEPEPVLSAPMQSEQSRDPAEPESLGGNPALRLS